MFEVRLPQYREDIDESLIVIWFVSEGDKVKEGDRLVEVQTEKAITEIEAEISGTIRDILVERGESVKAGEVLATIDPAGGVKEEDDYKKENVTQVKSQAAIEETPTVEESNMRVAPGLRRLAKELAVQLPMVGGTGRNGKITEEDIRRAAAGNSLEQSEIQTNNLNEGIPFEGIRAVIARRMTESLKDSAQLTITSWADVTDLEEKKAAIDEVIGWTALIGAAVAQTLPAHMALNAHVFEASVQPKSYIHLGFAIDTIQGLQVAVVRDANKQTPADLHKTLMELAEKTRNGKLSVNESSGSTFTITSLGQYHIQFFTPIINPPEAAILGIGQIEPHLELRDGIMAERMRLPLSLTFDHRAIDGAPAAQFLSDLVRVIEETGRLLGK
ncbi:dihydrolipoamide acetyltransferase family protein [Planococcus sp. YIM B11945]|uniref:dihydrolipoamide acetyltransferase family protein n=1 Tax=Planococcus sp. YIM B11945 TaxID=3435410 RepID=UPI003D7E9D84